MKLFNIFYGKWVLPLLVFTLASMFSFKVNAQVQLLNAFDPANNGLVPAPGGTPAGTKVLADNGTWITPSSLITSGTGITISGNQISNAGVISLSTGTTGLTVTPAAGTGAVTLAGTLAVANGGTGLNNIPANYLIYGNGTSAVSTLAPSATSGYLLQSNGAGSAPSWVAPSSIVGNTVWLLGGNSNVTTSSYLGSQSGNDVPLVFKVNGVQAGYLGDNNSANSFATSFGVNSTAAYRATMIGYGATNVSGGTDNVSVGYNASSGWQSVAIGETSTASGGGNTVAIGYNAVASGYQGIAIGSGAIASGSPSVAVGFGATAAYQGTAIGTNTSATGNNSTALGYGATTSQANALILGNSNVSVGIGTSTPGYKLDVAGAINFTGTLGLSGNTGNTGQILQSNGAAAPTWVNNPATTVSVYPTWGSGYSGYHSNSPNGGTNNAPYSTGTTITLPPGKWLIMSTILLSCNTSPGNGQGTWIRLYWSDAATGANPTQYTFPSPTTGGYLISGYFYYPGTYGLATGQTVVNNTTAGNITLYLVKGNQDAYGNFNCSCNQIGAAQSQWGEDNVIAMPIK